MPGFVSAYIYLMVAMIVLAFLALIGMFIWAAWMAWKRRGNTPPGEIDDGGGGGGGNDDPPRKPLPNGGPDRSIDEQFHALADAIGKTIQIEEKEREKVLR